MAQACGSMSKLGTVDFTSLRTLRKNACERGTSAIVLIVTQTHGNFSSCLKVCFPWVCVKIKMIVLVPRSHTKFHGVRSDMKSTVEVNYCQGRLRDSHSRTPQTWSSDLAAEQETSVYVVMFVSLSLSHGHLMSVGKYFTMASKPIFRSHGSFLCLPCFILRVECS